MKSKTPRLDGRRVDRAALARIAAAFDLRVLNDAGVIEGRALAARLLNDKVASTETFKSIRRASGAMLLGHYEDGALTGLLAAFPLNQAGHACVREGAFDAIAVDRAFVCWDEATPEAYYGWGFVASTKTAGRAVVKATAALQQTLLWGLPIYARAVSGDGMRALTSLGFRSFLDSDQDLLRLDPKAPGQALSR